VTKDSISAKGDLRLTRLTKSYGEFTAVDDLSLVIPEGSFFALLGPSGCGKTTTLRMIAGLEEPTVGSIHLGTTDITTTKPYQRPINTVFQNYALFPHLTIYENIAFGLRRRGIKDVDAAVSKVLDLVELPHLAQRKPTQLSGGQQQRIALARAIVNRPALLLLDEPLGALDLKLRRQMQIELKWIQKEVGLTFVHVTHDQEEAMTMADTIAVMNEGQIEQMGSPADLQKNRSHAVDNSIYAGIRPEKFRISRLGTPTSGNILTGGHIEDVSYIGVSTQYQVEMPWGQELMVFEQNDDGVAPFSKGEEVNISWEPIFTFGLRGDEDATAGSEVNPEELDEE
jgi:spermidine/putrescine transport system ATP-binding protein